MKRVSLFTLLAAFFLSTISGAAPVASSKKVRVAAASDLKFAFEELTKDFNLAHPEVAIEPTFGSSGNFYSQLANKAPFDMYLSADIAYPKKLGEQKLVEKGSEFTYAVGHIVLWIPRGSHIGVRKLGVKSVLHEKIKKVAIANPAHAPYGRAAEAALKKLGVYEKIKDKIVMGDNVAQTAQFVESGAADIGVIALSLALAPGMKDKGDYWEFPLDSYPTLEQGGVILSWSQDSEAANLFRTYLTSAEARPIFKKFGFAPPQQEPWTGKR